MDQKSKVHRKYEAGHVKSSEVVQDFIIGMADGLTVPFALVAGLSSVVNSSGVIVLAGVTEIIAGTISMGLGGYLAAKTRREHYEKELEREVREIKEVPEIEAQEVNDILEEFGVPKENTSNITNFLRKNPKKWLDFMMRFELGLMKPDKNREIISPITIGGAYAVGGLIPLSPYIFIREVDLALYISISITIISLLCFGVCKGIMTGASKIKSAFHTCAVGSIAALVTYSLAKLFA
jgi:vacuolar iron transporter family protein